MSPSQITLSALKAHRAVIRALARHTMVGEFCAEVCGIINEALGLDFSWLALAGYDGARELTLVAAEGQVPLSLEGLRETWLAEPGRAAPAAEALSGGKTVLIGEDSVGTGYESWFCEARERGCRASALLPLTVDVNPAGVLAVYAKDAGSLTPDVMDFMQELARDIAFGIRVLGEAEERDKDLKDMAVKDAAMESSLNAILIADHSWRTTYANPAFLNLWGYNEVGEVLGVRTDTFWESEEQSRQVGRALLREGSWFGEMTARRRDGSTFPAEMRGNAVSDENGYRTHFMVVSWDITERRRSEAGMQVKDAAMETSLNGILIGDGAWRTTYANPAFLEMWGYDSMERVLGLRTDTFWESEEQSRQVGRALLREGSWFGEMTARRRDGSTFIAEMRGNAVSDETGYKTSFMVVCSDITDRKWNEEQLKKSLDEKNVLLQEIHHRVKNNLQAVCGLLNLQGTFVDDPHARAVITESEARIRSMALIHEKLYQVEDLARIDMKEYLDSLMTYLGSSTGTGEGMIRLTVAARPLLLNVDTVIPCGLIVNELVSNSLKYAFPGGRGEVVVGLSMDDGGIITLTVSDDGVGLPEDIGGPGTRTLGLTLVRSFVDGLGGDMEISRRGGTCFTIRFQEYKGGGDKVVRE